MSGSILAMKGSVLFYICFLMWFIINGILYISIPQSVLFFGINHWRSVPADIFFTGITYLGNGIVIVLIGIFCLLFKKRNIGIGLIFSFVVSGMVTLIIKHYLNFPRPAAWFTDPSMVKTAPWLFLHYKYSFPSGHATSVFAVATTISLFLPGKRWVGGICFLIAGLTAYSRVYLGEHFLEDVWIGSLVGVFFGTACFLIQQKWWIRIEKGKDSKMKEATSQEIEL